MTLNIGFVKQHWVPITGSLVGLLVLYYLAKAFSGSKPAKSPDISGGDQSSLNLSAAASLQNAQINGQVEVAQIQGQVQQAAVGAQLQASLAKTAAELQATNLQTTADVAKTSLFTNADIQKTSLLSTADVAKTQIEGQTITHLGDTAASVQLARINTVGKQVDMINTYAKNAGQSLTAAAPILLGELNLPSASSSASASKAATDAAKSPASTIGAIGGGISSILAGVFA